MNKKRSEKKILGDNILKNLLVIIITGVAAVFLALFLLQLYTRHGQNVIVPRLEGLQVSEANAILKSKGLHSQIVDSIYRRDAVPGSIIDQTPKANNKVKEGRAIYITVYSKNPQQIAVPGLVDYSTRQAMALLNSMGFTQLAIEEVPSEYSGLVMAVEYRGKTLRPEEEVPAGSPLKLVVGSGVLADSLKVNREYIVPPSQVIQSDENTTPIEEGAIDESFF